MSQPIPISSKSTVNPCTKINKEISLQTRICAIVLTIFILPVGVLAYSISEFIINVAKGASYIISKISSLANRVFLHHSTPDIEDPNPIKEKPEIMAPLSNNLNSSITYLNSLMKKLELLQSIPNSLEEIQIHNECFSADIEKVANLQKLLSEENSLAEKDLQDRVEKNLFPRLKSIYNKYIWETFCQHGDDLKDKLLTSVTASLNKILFYKTIVEILIDFTQFQNNPNAPTLKTEFIKIKNRLNSLLENIENSRQRRDWMAEINIKEDIRDIKQICTRSLFMTNEESLEKLCPQFLQKLKSPRKKLAMRKNILKNLIVHLNQKELGHVILVGSAGSGKSALLEILAEKLPSLSPFRNSVFYKLKADSLGSDISYVGTLEGKLQKMKSFFEALKTYNKVEKIFVIIDEIHQLTGMGTTRGSGNDVWQSLKEDLGNSEYIFIGTTTPEEYDNIIAQDSAVTSRFTKIKIPELTEDEKKSILKLAAQQALKSYELTAKSSEQQIIVKAKIELVKEQYKKESELSDQLGNLAESIKREEAKRENSVLEDKDYIEYERKIDDKYYITGNVREIIKKFNFICSEMQLENTDAYTAIF